MLTPPADLADLCSLSAKLGADPALIQGAGGNTSVKDGAVMWIKASGTQLAEADTRAIFVPVDLPAMRSAMAASAPRADTPAEFALSNALRPSIETSLHAVFSQRIVVHVHCVNTIAWVIQTDAAKAVGQVLRGFDWAYVPYAKPGADLARLVQAALGPQTDVILLGNHGLLVAAQTVAAAQDLLARVIAALTLPARAHLTPDLTGLAARADADFIPLPADHPAHQIALSPDLTAAALSGSLYPDHVVFLGIGATELRPDETPPQAAKRRQHANLTPPVFLLVQGQGTLIRRDASLGAQAMLRCLGDVLTRLCTGANLRTLTNAENAALLDWDAEKYRQVLNAS